MLDVLIKTIKIIKSEKVYISPFHVTGFFLCPLATSENQSYRKRGIEIGGYRRGYRKRPVT